jgi:hypothetical protein
MTICVTKNGALERLLTEYRGRDCSVLLNSGNRGDGISHEGGRQFMSAIGITPREFHEADFSRMQGDVLLIHGAGSIARRPHALKQLMKYVVPRFATIVLLPTSFDLEDSTVKNFAASWNQKYQVFCRELVTFSGLQSMGVAPRTILLGQDLALHADLTEWSARPAIGRAGLFRRDDEAAYGRLPRDFDEVADASAGSEREPQRLLDFVSRFQEIHTDRSHAAIVAAMMGRKVVFYRNRYFKNRAIYDHSLAGLPNVRFARGNAFSLAQFTRVFYWTQLLPLQNKIQRLFQGPATAAA